MAKRKSEDVFSAKEKADLWRSYQLMTGSRAAGPITIEGVTLDLRHGLDPDLWQVLCPLGTYGRGATLTNPEIVFPWTPPDWRSFMETKGPVIDVVAGDLIFVADVRDWPLNSTFEDLEIPDNREAKLVYYAVGKADGGVQIAQRGQVFVRQSAVANLIASGDYGGAYRGMLKRLETAFGVEEIEDLADGPVEAWPTLPPNLSASFGAAFLALHDREKDFDGHAMAAFGYLIGRAEAEGQLLDSAKRGVRALSQARQASRVKAARDQADLAPILDAAREMCLANRNLSVNKCAKALATQFDKDDRWIAKKIKAPLFELRPNQREYRPRADLYD